MTSNLPFSRWGQVFGEATIASAVIDRIVHHADVIALQGASYRIKHTAIVRGSRLVVQLDHYRRLTS